MGGGFHRGFGGRSIALGLGHYRGFGSMNATVGGSPTELLPRAFGIAHLR
jgi:hypothetical protein